MSKKIIHVNDPDTVFKAACQDTVRMVTTDLDVTESGNEDISRLLIFLNNNADDAAFEGDSGIIAITRGVSGGEDHSSHLTVAYIIEGDVNDAGFISLKTTLDCFVTSDHYCLRKAVSITDFRSEDQHKSKNPKQSPQALIREFSVLDATAVLRSSLPRDKMADQESDSLRKFLKSNKKGARFEGAQFHGVINHPSYQYTAQSTMVYKCAFPLDGGEAVNSWIRLSCFVEEDRFTLRKDVFTREVKFNENPDHLFDSAEEMPAKPAPQSRQKANKPGSRGQVKGARLTKKDSPLETPPEVTFAEDLRIYENAVEVYNGGAISQESALLIEDKTYYDIFWSLAPYEDDDLERFCMAHRLYNQATLFFLGDADVEAFEEWMSHRHDEFITVRETVDVFMAEHPNTPSRAP